MKIIKSLYLHNRLFLALSVTIVLLVFGFYQPVFFVIGKLIIFYLVILFVTDFIFLYHLKSGINATRSKPARDLGAIATGGSLTGPRYTCATSMPFLEPVLRTVNVTSQPSAVCFTLSPEYEKRV